MSADLVGVGRGRRDFEVNLEIAAGAFRMSGSLESQGQVVMRGRKVRLQAESFLIFADGTFEVLFTFQRARQAQMSIGFPRPEPQVFPVIRHGFVEATGLAQSVGKGESRLGKVGTSAERLAEFTQRLHGLPELE